MMIIFHLFLIQSRYLK